MVRGSVWMYLGILPTSTVVTLSVPGPAVLRATSHYHCHRGVSLAFGWTPRLSTGELLGGRRLSPLPSQGVVKASSEIEPYDLAVAPPTLLASVAAVACDVDGTLTTAEMTVSDRTVAAAREVLDSEVLFFPATGRTRRGVYDILGQEISSRLIAKNTPGVFLQGLVVYFGSGDEVLYERLLDAHVVKQVSNFCEEKGVSFVAYSGDRIVCSAMDENTDRIADYKEPMPEVVGPLVDAMVNGLRIHKVILIDTKEAIDRVRPEMERLVGAHTTLTQGQPDILEVLPAGASKGNGVEILLKHLGVDPGYVMALGDAENDVEMLRLAGIGVCVGNASPPARAAARFIAPTNAEDGAAVAMERMLSCRNIPLQ